MRYRTMNKGLFAAAAVVAFFALARPSAAQDFRGGRTSSRDSGWRSRGSVSQRGEFRGGIQRRGGDFRGFRDRAFPRGFRGGVRSYAYAAPYYGGYIAPYPVYDGYVAPYDGYSDGYYDSYAYAPGYVAPYPAYYGPRVDVRVPLPRLRLPFPRFHVRIGR